MKTSIWYCEGLVGLMVKELDSKPNVPGSNPAGVQTGAPRKRRGGRKMTCQKAAAIKFSSRRIFGGRGGREKNARRTKNEEREVMIRLLQRRALETTISQNLKGKCVPCCLAEMCKSGPPFGTAWRSKNWEATSRLAVCRAPPWGIGKRLSS